MQDLLYDVQISKALTGKKEGKHKQRTLMLYVYYEKNANNWYQSNKKHQLQFRVKFCKTVFA